MRPPEFWDRPDALESRLLQPAAWLFATGAALRRRLARPERAPLPVICIGNLTVGGAGKTPTVIALAERLKRRGARPHIITRGYKGALRGPVLVDPRRHGVAEVGDEALLLARVAPTWVARDRASAARMAKTLKARCVLLDDGFQNPHLVHDCAILVVDGSQGFGNARVLPAGPLREPVGSGLARASAVLVIGPDEVGVERTLPPDLPRLAARLGPETGASRFRGAQVVAFAGIGRPAKFFRSLEDEGAQVIEAIGFPDHHAYTERDIGVLIGRAKGAGARLVTTEKDLVRIPPSYRGDIEVLKVELWLQAWEPMDRILQSTIRSPKFTDE